MPQRHRSCGIEPERDSALRSDLGLVISFSNSDAGTLETRTHLVQDLAAHERIRAPAKQFSASFRASLHFLPESELRSTTAASRSIQ